MQPKEHRISRRLTWQYMLKSLTISISLGAAAAVILFIVNESYNYGKQLAGVERDVDATQNKSLQTLEAQVADLRDELNKTKQVIATTAAGNVQVQFARQLQQVTNDLRKLEEKQGRIEKAILANPAKALEIPLIQRDIEAIKASQQSAGAVLKDSVDRVYDLNKWLLGGMAVSIMALALSTLLPTKRKPDSD